MKYVYQIAIAATCTGMTAGSLMADDLNPAPYRDGPLSVFAHWFGDPASGRPFPQEPNEFSAVDDNDPSTTLWDGPATWESIPITPGPTSPGGDLYWFTIPNWVDQEPLKQMRIQITWFGINADGFRPEIDHVTGFETDATGGTSQSDGVETFASDPLVFTQPDGGYRYYDYEIRPNPDYEMVHIFFPEGTQPQQIVIDTISLPAPGTAALAGLGGLCACRRRR